MSCTVYVPLPLQGGTVFSSENVLCHYLLFVFLFLIFLRNSNLSPLNSLSFANFSSWLFFSSSRSYSQTALIGVMHTGWLSGLGCCASEIYLEMSACFKYNKHSCNPKEKEDKQMQYITNKNRISSVKLDYGGIFLPKCLKKIWYRYIQSCVFVKWMFYGVTWGS